MQPFLKLDATLARKFTAESKHLHYYFRNLTVASSFPALVGVSDSVLYKESRLEYLRLVITSSPKTSAAQRLRLVSLLLFLTVLFLPLHFHPIAATAHVAKECGCLHGARTEMGMAPSQVDWTPPTRAVFLESYQPQFFSGSVSSLQSIRAPPVF
jgi:hypothetical protein